jgi:crossover junction endodeoxyribonuclease RusA
MIEFKIPFPPSLRSYYRIANGRTYISAVGQRFLLAVQGIVLCSPKLRRDCPAGAVTLSMDVYPPDRRRRDLDNLWKPVQDSLVKAGLLADDNDSIIVRHEAERVATDVEKIGWCTIRIEPYTPRPALVIQRAA